MGMKAVLVRKGTILLGMLALLIAACAPTEDAAREAGDEAEVPDEILVGATLPLTGEEADNGLRYQEGYELAFEVANEDGGLEIGGETVPVRLELLDDTTDQATAVNLAERLINRDQVHVMLGTYSTALVEAQSTVAEQNQIPYVNGGGAATAIYDRGYQWIFGALAPVELLATTQMEWIQKEQEAGNVPDPAEIALLWENTSHGEDYRKGVQDFAEQSGGSFEVVVDESFELDSKDFSAVLSKVKSSGADLFLADAHLPDYVTMQRQYVSSDLCHDVITYGARGSEADAAEALGQENVNYILSAVWWNAQLGEQGGQNEQFINAYKERYNTDPEWYQALGYETVRALFTAIEDAGSVEPEPLREALANLEMESILPGGQLSFPEETGYQADYPFVVQQNLPDGSSPIVYPEELATGKAIAPNPNCEG
ncbi:MAG: ABC transporter substrate-binding protein [Actinobacteria bacterium]|nr:ABC transporter substrate-binding protein [Actinomycetota bacterium]